MMMRVRQQPQQWAVQARLHDDMGKPGPLGSIRTRSPDPLDRPTIGSRRHGGPDAANTSATGRVRLRPKLPLRESQAYLGDCRASELRSPLRPRAGARAAWGSSFTSQSKTAPAAAEGARSRDCIQVDRIEHFWFPFKGYMYIPHPLPKHSRPARAAMRLFICAHALVGPATHAVIIITIKPPRSPQSRAAVQQHRRHPGPLESPRRTWTGIPPAARQPGRSGSPRARSPQKLAC